MINSANVGVTSFFADRLRELCHIRYSLLGGGNKEDWKLSNRFFITIIPSSLLDRPNGSFHVFSSLYSIPEHNSSMSVKS